MAKPLQIGDIAPAFTLKATKIEQLNSADLSGSKYVFYFYPKDDTSGCTSEAQDFNRLLPEFNQLNCQIIGISKDSVKSHQKFCDKYQLNFELLADETTDICQAYGVWVEKSMYGRKYFGIERTSFLIDEIGRILEIWRKVKVKGHADQVLAKLKTFL